MEQATGPGSRRRSTRLHGEDGDLPHGRQQSESEDAVDELQRHEGQEEATEATPKLKGTGDAVLLNKQIVSLLILYSLTRCLRVIYDKISPQ